MITVDPAHARSWARLGSRGSFGLALLDLASEDEDVFVLAADLCTTSGLDRFRLAHPDRFVNTGIAEQNMLGIAGGLAKEGYKVFCSSFATFISMRSFEMIRLNLGVMAQDIKVVGLAAGFAMGLFGNTHYAIEDIALMRAVPGLCILSPADCAEVVKCTQAAAQHHGPVYLRLTGVAGAPIVYDSEYDFEIGRAVTVREGSDVAVIATGSMVHEAIEAAKLLDTLGISASVVDMHTIKPLDTSVIDRSLDKRLIVTVEEHSVVGGLGGAVAEYKCGLKAAPPQMILGITDSFKKAGTYRYMLQQNGLTAPQIARTISGFLECEMPV